MIYIANYWNDSAYTTVKVYSNCDEVELNPVRAEAGIATILLKAGANPGSVKITAKSQGVETGNLYIPVR